MNISLTIFGIIMVVSGITTAVIGMAVLGVGERQIKNSESFYDLFYPVVHENQQYYDTKKGEVLSTEDAFKRFQEIKLNGLFPKKK